MTMSDTHRAIDAVWRIESARLIAGLARMVGDVGLAEELAQEGLVIALERWPESGVPDNPGAWLMATAKHRAIDRLRRRKLLERKQQELGRELQVERELAEPDLEAALDDDIGDDLRGRLGATGALRGCAPPGPDPGRAGSEGAGGPRPGVADGDPGLAPEGQGRPVRRAGPVA